MQGVKTALIHDWLITEGGAEKFLKVLHDLFPSPIYTLIHDKKWNWPEVHTSFLQKFPFSSRLYKNFLPLFPLAIEQFDLRGYDLVLSSSHAVAKGVLTHPDQLHICYCHTPMRYAWDLYYEYMQTISGFKRLCAKAVLHRLRTWDSASCSRVDHFLANSQYVARRIKRHYHREATVIYPPVDIERFSLMPKEDFYLSVSRLVPYKKTDLLVEAFSHMPKRRLVVIGEGPEMTNIKKKAGPNVEILGRLSDQEIADYMGRARALLFAAEEDFGRTPVEAQAAGTPVIAFGQGGVLETVVEGKTGLFFGEQTVASILDAVERFEKRDFVPEVIRSHAGFFSEERFKKEYDAFVRDKLEEFRAR